MQNRLNSCENDNTYYKYSCKHVHILVIKSGLEYDQTNKLKTQISLVEYIDLVVRVSDSRTKGSGFDPHCIWLSP